MSSEIAIRANGLGKRFQIYPSPRDRLKQFVLPRVQRVLRAKQHSYFYEFSALDNVSFEIRRGETFGIIGRNGSGKSTLLQILCGTLSPSDGTVEVNGRIAALLELGAGFNPEFTGRENVVMNARVLGLTQEEIEERYDSIVEFADIGQFIDRPVKTYSSGMYVRLAFAVIAHVDADILVIDEALSVGDAYFVQKCMRFLRSFIERGTLLFVSHDTGAVLNLCSRAILLEQGRVVTSGAPKVVVQRYLAALVESNQGAIELRNEDQSDIEVREVRVDPTQASLADEHSVGEDRADVRQELIDKSNLCNTIEVFEFNVKSASFGTGSAQIVSVMLLDSRTSLPLPWTAGGEIVRLRIRVRAVDTLPMPIVGFQVMDRLGQTIFADNTYLTHSLLDRSAESGDEIEATFEFRMPVLPTGDYSIGVAIADGTQNSHVQHHWIHDALIIRAHAAVTTLGLVGIPMRCIELVTHRSTGGKRSTAIAHDVAHSI